MNTERLYSDERAISPVVGVALLIAIAVILATVIGIVVLDLGPGGANAPQADLVTDYNQSGQEVTVTHRGGDNLPEGEVLFVDENGNEVKLSSLSGYSGTSLGAGESVTVSDSDFGTPNPINNGQTITVIWESPNGDKQIILEEAEP